MSMGNVSFVQYRSIYFLADTLVVVFRCFFFFFYMRESKASRLRQAASGWPIRLFHFRFFSIVIVVDNCTEGTCQKSREQK